LNSKQLLKKITTVVIFSTHRRNLSISLFNMNRRDTSLKLGCTYRHRKLCIGLCWSSQSI
jgi:hypothetical protein